MNLYDVLKKPVISEKAEVLREQNIYVFEVAKKSNKTLIKQAVKQVYNVVPEKVNIVNKMGKKSQNRFGAGFKPSRKKAYIYLKKGETIKLFEGA